MKVSAVTHNGKRLSTRIKKYVPSHQQRLDKVLSKFEEVSPKLHQIQLEHTQVNWKDERVLINYNELNKQFYFTTHVVLNVGCNTEKIVNVEYLISLDTVESLLKDLEVQDE